MLLRSLFIVWCILSALSAHTQVVRVCGCNPTEEHIADVRETLLPAGGQHSLSYREVSTFQLVFHIVLPQGIPVISPSQIIDQVEILNRDFAGSNENVQRLPDDFKNLVGDSGFRFCLADSDPEGNPANGITYTTTAIRDIGIQTGPEGRIPLYYDFLGGKTRWDPARYINVWVVEYGAGILGASSFPGAITFPEEQGIVIDYRYFGALQDAALQHGFGRGHTLTHEMGHFFGLLHIWGNGNTCDDTDEIEDTPNAQGPYFGCPGGIQESCGVSNMYQNFMDLTDDRCLAGFTHGQIQRMQMVVENFYPDLPGNGCDLNDQALDEWSESIQWAYDPLSGRIILLHPEAQVENIEIEVFSTDGRLVSKNTFQGIQSQRLWLDGVAGGIFFVRISDGEFAVTRKIVVY